MRIWPCCEDKSLYHVTIFIKTDQISPFLTEPSAIIDYLLLPLLCFFPSCLSLSDLHSLRYDLCHTDAIPGTFF